MNDRLCGKEISIIKSMSWHCEDSVSRKKTVNWKTKLDAKNGKQLI